VEKTVVWLSFYGVSHTIEMEIRNGLSRAGIHPASFEGGETATCRIMCFSEATEEVFANLREARTRGRYRILALAGAPSICAPVIWRLLHAGAADALAWDENGDVASQIRAKLDRWQVIDTIVADETARGSVIGQSAAWQGLIREAVEAARFTSAPILLVGESGTGKEVLAKLISQSTADNGMGRGELVTVDCAAIVPELSGSEFFGHERGAFTGAQGQREGAFALADGATLLLDEIGDVPLALQAQLLRAIQEKTYKRVGGNAWKSTNFRLICATNRDLEAMIGRGQFRLDLYYRIAGCVLRTPPLRERIEDILPLAEHFLDEVLCGKSPAFDDTVREYLVNRTYAGNVRELRQLIQRIAHRHVGQGPITPGDIPEDDRPASGEIHRNWPNEQLERSIADAIATGTSLKEVSRTTIETAIRIAVQSEEGNLQRAAKRLGVTDRALQIRRAAAGRSG
jgi:transcriptional regulator with GAF, ATPase, and Fis domain